MKAPRVSDRALIRFLERAGGLEMEQLRERLETSLTRAAQAAEQIGGGRFLIVADGLTFIVCDNTVVTIVEEGTSGDRARMLERPPQ